MPVTPGAFDAAIRTEINGRIRLLGVTMTSVAKSAKIDKANLSRYLNGNTEFRVDSIVRLVAALGGTYKETIRWPK